MDQSPVFRGAHNKNERVIRTAGKYRRVPEADIRRLQKQQGELIHRMRIGSRRG